MAFARRIIMDLVLIVLCLSVVSAQWQYSLPEESQYDLSEKAFVQKYRRQAETTAYDEIITQPSPIPEDAGSDTVLFDFNTVTISSEAASTFTFQVIETTDSVPQYEGLFVIEKRQVRFGHALSDTERRNYFDYEQYPTVVIIIVATQELGFHEKKWIKLSIPLVDVNDESPVLKNKPYPYQAAIPLEPEPGHTVYELLAEDPDTNSELEYRIADEADPDVKAFFRMEQVVEKDGTPDKIVEGHIKVSLRTAFTEGREFNIPVTIRDKQAVGQVTTATINVLVGPRPPQFFQEKYEGWIFETESTNNQVYTMPDLNGELIIQVRQFQDGYPMTFRVLDENNRESTQFRIDGNGRIYNKAALDFDVPRTLRPPKSRLIIKVTETSDFKNLENTVPLEITIKDENDNAPRFHLTQYMETVREDLNVGDTVMRIFADDHDSDDNAFVTYEVDSPYFDIKKVGNEGVITVKQRLDFDAEPGPRYRFVVYAKDNGVPALSSSVDVAITTENVNDEVPTIISPGVLVLRDEVRGGGFTLTRLRARDADGDNVRFYFSPRSERYEIFSIKPSSGIIQVVAPVPEDRDSYILNITAEDDGSCCGSIKTLQSEASVTVEIVDSVNQKPVFTNCLNYSNVAGFDEDIEPGEPVIQVSASDPDRGLNGIVTYSIESPSPSLSDAPFQIDPESGKITIKTKVNREAYRKDFIQVTVKGSDGAQNPQEGWCTFRVSIRDINDNDPVFNSLSYSEKISSNAQKGRIILRVGATDADIGDNARISYSLIKNGNGVFGIYEENGLIFLKKAPSVTHYELLVRAQDHGVEPRNATASVTIDVASETSEPPTFDDDVMSPGYHYRVAETVNPNSQDAIITTLTCRSNMDNPRVQYFLVDSRDIVQSQQAGNFAIREYQEGGRYKVDVMVAAQLDYEKANQHTIQLRCQNFGGLTMYEQITVTVDVEDRNNKVPYFEGMDSNGRYAGSVFENTNAGALVIEVQGYDDDVTPSYNQLVFRLSEQSYDGVLNDFEIRNLPGNKAGIHTKRPFDREEQPRFFLTVIADDQSPSDRINHKPPGSSNTASVIVQVTITDKNDNPMEFRQSLYTHTVKETASIGHVIFSVTADDKDEVDKGQLKYSFTSPDDIPFDIRDQTGEIVVTGKLDYDEGVKSYLLTLESRDAENFYSATTQVKIDILDENDNPPVFERPEYIIDDKVVEEDQSISKESPMPLIQVKATDKDVARTTNMRYRLLGEGTEAGDMQLFTIDQRTGQIYLVGILDRDTKSEYIFTVEATDEDQEPQKGYTNIKVKPLDINDNKPKFDQNRLTGEVFENTEPGCPNLDNCPPIAVVMTTDADYGENSTIDYEIVSSPAERTGGRYFDIDAQGRIFSQVEAKFLDRETRPKFEVVVRAKDRGPEPQTATATVIITLKDRNDNPPKFTQREYQVSMSEHQEEGIVTEVHATDLDIGVNAELQFSMSEQAALVGYFKVDTIDNHGAISVYQPVDFEKLMDPVFRLEIIVQDKNPLHRDTATVVITVEDFNDEAPKFKDEYMEVEIEENREPGKVIATFEATDADSGINAMFSFLIDRDSDRRREFVIHPDTGVVQTRKKLDREVQASMFVVIKAVDKGDPRQTGTATLEVTVTDTNDNFPVFKEDYRPVVMENMKKGDEVTVLEVFAVDHDTLIYGPPFGFALPDNCSALACSHFDLTPNDDGDERRGTAIITTRSVFDREEHKYYELPIVMWDMRDKNSDKARTGTNTLTIVIGDQNDNPHFPGHQNVFVYNYKGMFGPLQIGRVYAEDLDDWDLPDKTFTFLSPPSMKNFFSVDEDTGDITMKRGVRANFGEEPYQFKVSVHDKKTVVSTVAVTVKDLSDEAVQNSGAVRLAGVTAEEFILEPKDKRTGRRTDSLYTQFRMLMMQKLGYDSIDHVEIITLLNGPDYLEVRYAAHGSPYLSSAQLDNIIIMNKQEFEDLGVSVLTVPIDNCQEEVFEGGCYNKLVVTGQPVLVNANGTSYVGVEAYTVAAEGCKSDEFPEKNNCDGGYCFNGGTCVKDNWGTLSCVCMDEFDGPRCQQRSHHFDGNSVAFYRTLEQCEDSQTSLDFMTAQDDGVILYNGPLVNIDPLESPQDFIFLFLRGGFPVLLLDHGTGVMELTLDGTDKHGSQLMKKLSDGRWHHIDINRKGKMVELVVDRCSTAESQRQHVQDDKACRVRAETPGENTFLNVDTHLHLGGVQAAKPLNHLSGHPIVGFNGCIKNLVHNKRLYDLHYKPVSGINTGNNGCPPEAEFCGRGSSKPECGFNGICESSLSGLVTCQCLPGWFGKSCDKPATVRDFGKKSYYLWMMKEELFSSQRLSRNREISAQLMFRTRETNGILLDMYDSSSSESARHIQLKLHNGKVRLQFNLGDGDKTLDLENAQANNGRWHRLRMDRYGTEFHLRLDGGEGRNYAYRLGSEGGTELEVFKVSRMVFSGAVKQGLGLSSVLREDLISTCIQDVRINDGYFAMTDAEGNDPDTMARVEENRNTREGCVREDCLRHNCKVNTICVPLWEFHECRCLPGSRKVGNDCFSSCIPNPCFNNVTCSIVNSDIKCQCPPGWRGQFCDELGPEEVKSGDLSDGALVIILVSLIVVILLALIVFLLWRFCPHRDEGEKYILEVDAEDDIRENVMNYDEEGAGEEDQDAYDLFRLQRANFETPGRPYDMERRMDMKQSNAGPDKPDVGNFIDGRMKDADNDDGAPPHDAVREFNFEGGDSEAGSLSSLSTSSSERAHEYDYLNDWGPKFSKLADMYGAGQDLEDW